MATLKKEWRELRGESIPYLFQAHPEPKSPLAVFLHGFPDDPQVWQAQFEGAADKFHLLAPYIGRVGNKRLPKARLELERLVLDVLELINHKVSADTEIVIMAHDLGGSIARELEFLLGARLKLVAYLNSMGVDVFAQCLKNPRQLKKSYYMALFQMPFVTPFLLSKVMPLLESEEMGARENPDVWQGIELYRSLIKELPTQRGASRKSFCKAVFIFGLKDPYLEVPRASDIAQFYDKAEIRVIESGHWPQKTHADLIKAYVENKYHE